MTTDGKLKRKNQSIMNNYQKESMKTMQRMALVMLTVFVGLLTVSAQQEMPQVPIDKDVRIGKLDNGLTYYIRHNNWPENRAEFYIAQRVGSIQEEDNQRGLAHFLEHMCFNGTTHFQGNDLIRYCESIGVKFGRDLNAYTSIDCTVYNISNVPTSRQSALDSCLLILYDWADGLTLDPKEIDKERGVIHEEWRTRTSSSMRILERALPLLYAGSKYGYRMPIGIMEVIDNFKPQVLRDYYEKWYRPDNQGIIVVGDVDVDHVEAQIKQLFGNIKVAADAAKVEEVSVPDNSEAIVIIDKDKEETADYIDMMFKHETTPDSVKSSLAYLITDYVKNIAVQMFRDRLTEYEQKPECPFVQGYVSDGQYIFAKTKDAFDLSALPKEGQHAATVAALYREALRAARFGFTPTEYARAKANSLSYLEKQYLNKDKRRNSQFCEEYKQHFLSNEPIPSIDDYYQVMKQMIPVIPLEAVNEVMASLVSQTDTNLVILSTNVEKEGAVYPTREALLQAVYDVRGEELTPYVDNVKNEPLISSMPKKGSIKKEKKNDKLGYSELLLSNGVKVLLKHTDYKKDQVLLQAEGFGGSSLYGKDDYINLKLFDEVIEASGLGNFSHTELEKALAGKIAGVSMSLGTRRQTFSGSSTPNDVETLLQLVYLYFTKINKDEEAFNNLMKSMELSLKNRELSPDVAFNDSVNMTLRDHNERFRPLSIGDLESVNYDRILEIAKERTANAAAYTFTIVGNYDEATIRPLLEQYLGSLPSQKKVVKGHRVDNTPKGVVVNSFRRKMETPKAIAIMVWNNEEIPYNLESRIYASVTGQVLSMIYLQKIREDAGAAYSAGGQGSADRLDEVNKVSILAYCPMKPDMSEMALSIMREEMDKMATTVDETMLTKVKEFMLKNYDDQVKTNGYWSDVLNDWNGYGLDMNAGYKEIVIGITPAKLSAFVKKVLKPGNRIEVVMLPEE